MSRPKLKDKTGKVVRIAVSEADGDGYVPGTNRHITVHAVEVEEVHARIEAMLEAWADGDDLFAPEKKK